MSTSGAFSIAAVRVSTKRLRAAGTSDSMRMISATPASAAATAGLDAARSASASHARLIGFSSSRRS